MNSHDAYAALRYRDYVLFSVGRVIATLAGQMRAVALGWQIYDLTHSALALGYVGLVQVIPSISLALWAGHIADRRDRRAILLSTQTARILIFLALIAATRLTFHTVGYFYAILFLDGIIIGFQGPAASALLPQLVPAEVFPNAITWRTTLFQLSSLAGPLLGGWMLNAHNDPAQVYAVGAALSLASLGALVWMKPQPFTSTTHHEPMLQSLMSGVRYVIHNRIVLAAMTLDLFAVLFGGAVALLPIYAKDILHVGPAGLGALGAATSAGAILMAVSLVHRPPIRRSGQALLGAVAAFGVAMIGFGLSKSFVLSFLFLTLSGAVDNVSMVIRSTLIQGMTPNEMRGRVSAVNGVFVSTSNELGRFESGLAAQIFGTVPSVVLGGTLTLGVVAVASWLWPELRRLGSLETLTSKR